MAMKIKEVTEMAICLSIQQLVEQALALKLIEKEDTVYARNQILSLLQVDDFHLTNDCSKPKEMVDLLEDVANFAINHELIEDLFDEKEILKSKIMNTFIPRPSIVNKEFYEKYHKSPVEATNAFYELSQNSQYIQMKRIQKNISYQIPTEYGDLDITINLSKPEKDPKLIAKVKEIKSSEYPKCLLCVENEGYQGRIGHPARSNHRMIRVELEGEKWYLQYSPYVYYNEHCILLSEHHRNMKIDRHTFSSLLAFVDMFPHYFIGSNADLPIVGGSILTHDHYQGGHYEFPMAKGETNYDFTLNAFPEIKCSIIKWPMSVIRLKSEQKENLINAAELVLQKWKTYNDPTVNILAFTNHIPHNTITPIARTRNGVYELDLVLRNNRTSAEHPLGIFHPHRDVQHIKKENIGLIEVMGLAVLPARLKFELQEVEKFLLNKPSEVAHYHLDWAKELKDYHHHVHSENVTQLVREEVGKKFLRVLEDAGVFKRNVEGMNAFKRFIQSINSNKGACN